MHIWYKITSYGCLLGRFDLRYHINFSFEWEHQKTYEKASSLVEKMLFLLDISDGLDGGLFIQASKSRLKSKSTLISFRRSLMTKHSFTHLACTLHTSYMYTYMTNTATWISKCYRWPMIINLMILRVGRWLNHTNQLCNFVFYSSNKIYPKHTSSHKAI